MGLHQFFIYCAVGGGALFLVQLVLSMLGAGDADIPSADHPPTGHSSTDTSFKILSLQGLTAFFGMFGLVGLALQDESKAGPTVSVLGALAAGSFSTWVISRIFRAAHSLQSSGTLDLSKAVGSTGTVYLRIAPDKPGKVTLNLHGRLVQLDAVTTVETLETGSEVRVERVLADGTVSVLKAS
ncbi:MAG: hypothetical protein QM778_26380 [Myxococcales bacterium]